MKVREALVGIVVLTLMVSGCSSVLAHPAIDVTGFTEIVNYQPDESITLRTLIVNNVSDTVNATKSQIRIPWGSGPLYSEGVCYSNVPIIGKPFFPNATQTHAYDFDYYRGSGAYVFFQGFTINAGATKELIYTLKINDWTGQCPTGDTWHQFPYSMWMTSNDDVFMDTFLSTIRLGNESELKRLDPRKGTFGDMPPEYEVGRFRITSSMLPNQYGAFPNSTQMDKDNTEIVNVSIFNGTETGEVTTNTTVSLEGCGVHKNSSTYPYEFEITPTEYGKIRIVANWTENSTGTEVELRGEGIISVTKPDGLVDWESVDITRTPMPDGSTVISVNASNTEGKEYMDSPLLTYSPADRPWAMQVTMEKHSDEYEATIEAFEPGRVVNYTIIGFDIAGLWKEIVNESFVVLPPIPGFDTGEGGYPSISGVHNGTITLAHDVNVSMMYTYPCAGTGGHAEYVRIWNSTLDVNATWNGYTDDWHNLSFGEETFVLEAGETYNYTIHTGSYPQIIHTSALTTADGDEITCTEFMDANGVVHYDWIPAIRLFAL